MTKIILTRSMVLSDIQYIKDGLDKEVKGLYEFIVPDEWSEERLTELAVNADIFLGPYVTKRILENAKQLRLIQIPWTGMDTFDFSTVVASNVIVCNTHSNADAVAEMGISLALDLLKKVSYHDRKMRLGNWNRDQKILSLKSKMLSEQTVCILGYGNIGSRIGKLAAAFGSKVIAVSGRERTLEDPSIELYGKNKIADALSKANIVFCTLPLTDATYHFIDERLFLQMEPGTLLINMSRAAIIDEDAIWNSLKTGRLGGFASDVWWKAPKRGETESYPSSKYEFWKLENVIMSPHRAGFIENSLPHLDGAISNIAALIKGEQLQNIVDVNKQY